MRGVPCGLSKVGSACSGSVAWEVKEAGLSWPLLLGRVINPCPLHPPQQAGTRLSLALTLFLPLHPTPPRHLMAAEVPYQYRPDILLVESTYGVQNHPPQEERERR